MIKNSIIYILTGAFSALIPILLMPYLIQNLAPQDYGLINLFSTCQLFLLPILGFSSNSAVSRQFFDSSINLSVYIGNYFYILFGSVFLIVGLFFLFDNFILSMTGLSSIWLCLVLICSIAQNIIATRLSLFQVSERADRFFLFQCINISLNIALTYFLISTFNYGKDGRIYAITISAIFLGIVSVYSLKSEGLIDLKLNTTYLKDAIKYSSPLIFHSTAGSIMGMSDRFLITKLISLEATGIYSVAFQIGGALNLISTGINNAFIPWLFKKLSDEQFDRKILIRYTYIFYLFLFSIFGVYLLFDNIINNILICFLPKEYSDAIKIIPFLLLATIFNAMYLSVTNYMFYLKKTLLLSIVTISIAIFNIFCSYFLISEYGILGASISMCVSYFILFIVVWLIVYYKYPLPWF